ncbi:MAG: 30S ribosomal protein S11 [Verrucomicrobia bacterium]|nr:30S ribosomal protein S11 [Verrucomicrobiota bacterium]MCF7707840.1 30S ribosomal protein S11 [Verrucomicrobiota bacterium]
MADETKQNKEQSQAAGQDTNANTEETAKKQPESTKAQEPKQEKPDQQEKKAQADKTAAADKSAGDAHKAPTAAELLAEDVVPKKIIKAKGSKNVTAGIVTIVASFNNTMVTIADKQGNVLSWSSSGKIGFRGSRKSTAFAAQQVTQDAARRAMAHGLREVEVHVNGPGSGRESAIRALQVIGIEIVGIKDVTPVPHNGCRPRKKRRV